jgi:hypothetical protein
LHVCHGHQGHCCKCCLHPAESCDDDLTMRRRNGPGTTARGTEGRRRQYRPLQGGCEYTVEQRGKKDLRQGVVDHRPRLNGRVRWVHSTPSPTGTCCSCRCMSGSTVPVTHSCLIWAVVCLKQQLLTLCSGGASGPTTLPPSPLPAK